MNRLWTKNYTIITIGSVVSMLGNSMAGFAMSLFVLDYTQSPLYYAIYMFLYTLPQIAARRYLPGRSWFQVFPAQDHIYAISPQLPYMPCCQG